MRALPFALDRFSKIVSTLLLACAGGVLPGAAEEPPYFVTYDHHMEEPGNLEVAVSSTIGVPRSGQTAFFAPYAELGYGVKGWWTTELYIEGQSRPDDSAIFTGWRLENRFRPLAREHKINPILYLEFEDINEGSLIQKEVVGHAFQFDEPNEQLRHERARELEGKLILSSNVRDWNISENFIVEKNLSENEGFEFGYALGVARPLARMASGSDCRWCRENFSAGVELYGGLGSTERFGFAGTAHYLAPVISWRLSDNVALHFSPGFGLNRHSSPVLFRFGYMYEVRGFGRKVASLFRGGHE